MKKAKTNSNKIKFLTGLFNNKKCKKMGNYKKYCKKNTMEVSGKEIQNMIRFKSKSITKKIQKKQKELQKYKK